MPNTTTARRSAAWVTPLCWSAVLLDGFDLVVLGTVIPVLLRDKVWDITPAGATAVATTGLIGMTIGAMTIGTITDYLGRRRVMILAATIFSIFTLLCAVSTSIAMFGAFRFLAGLGLGGCLPTAITLATEFARRGRASSAATLIMTGYHVGAVLTAVLGLLVMGRGGHGWQWMFVIGGLPGLILAPLMIRYLPESEVFLERRSRKGNPVRALFEGGMARPTIAFWATSFLGLILVYGLNTWLPGLMITAGYPLEQGLGLLLILNVGAIVGLLIAGRVANRVGVRIATLAWFSLAALLLAALSIKMATVPLYLAVFVTGAFVFSAQVLVYAYVGHVYPVSSRATGLGWTAGVGRIGAIVGPIIIGALLSADSGYPWGFYVFALVAAGAAVMTLVVGRPRDVVDEEISDQGAVVAH
jgi:AAHS family benzoate transporter-like MFS transporter